MGSSRFILYQKSSPRPPHLSGSHIPGGHEQEPDAVVASGSSHSPSPLGAVWKSRWGLTAAAPQPERERERLQSCPRVGTAAANGGGCSEHQGWLPGAACLTAQSSHAGESFGEWPHCPTCTKAAWQQDPAHHKAPTEGESHPAPGNGCKGCTEGPQQDHVPVSALTQDAEAGSASSGSLSRAHGMDTRKCKGFFLREKYPSLSPPKPPPWHPAVPHHTQQV